MSIHLSSQDGTGQDQDKGGHDRAAQVWCMTTDGPSQGSWVLTQAFHARNILPTAIRTRQPGHILEARTHSAKSVPCAIMHRTM